MACRATAEDVFSHLFTWPAVHYGLSFALIKIRFMGFKSNFCLFNFYQLFRWNNQDNSCACKCWVFKVCLRYVASIWNIWLVYGERLRLCVCFRDPCVICCGQTLMIAVAGESLHVELVTRLDRTFLRPSTTLTASRWCPALISWSWRWEIQFSSSQPFSGMKIIIRSNKTTFFPPGIQLVSW